MASYNSKPLNVRVATSGCSRHVDDWRKEAPGRAWQTAVGKWARKHGVAGVLRNNGSYTLFYMQGGKLRQRTWRKTVPVHVNII